MADLTYNPNAVKELAKIMGEGMQERAPCGVTIKTNVMPDGYVKNALDLMREDLKKQKNRRKKS